MGNDVHNFKQNKYLVVREVLPKDLTHTISKYLWIKQKFGSLSSDKSVKADFISREPLLDLILDYLSVIFSKYTGLQLLPTYSYARIYYRGADLERHVDRPSCEISGTMPLDYSDEAKWPILVATITDDPLGKQINLAKGDLLLYRGEEVFHWRESLEKEWQTQIFFHFVEKNGKNEEWAFDKRKRLSMTLKRLSIYHDITNFDRVGKALNNFLKKQLFILKVMFYLRKYGVLATLSILLLLLLI